MTNGENAAHVARPAGREPAGPAPVAPGAAGRELSRCEPARCEPAQCEHGAGPHDGSVPSHATAPAGSKAWLLVEHRGPWAEHAAQTALPEPLRTAATVADKLGIRVQLIRRPLRGDRGGGVYAGWTAGPAPWLRKVGDVGALDPYALAEGEAPPGGNVPGPVLLVCAHGRRDMCCGRYGGPLARQLAGLHPGQVWETTHLGGHRFAANLAILPHGIYYGPVDLRTATEAIAAYRRGEVTVHRYRGRAGQPPDVQAAEHAALAAAGTMPLSASR